MKQKLIVKRLPQDTYNRAITFVYGTAEQANRFLRARGWKGDPLTPQDMGRWICHLDDDYEADFIVLIRNPHFAKERRLATLAHECFHCARHALRRAGARGEEAEAYYLGWLYEQCLRAMA